MVTAHLMLLSHLCCERDSLFTFGMQAAELSSEKHSSDLMSERREEGEVADERGDGDGRGVTGGDEEREACLRNTLAAGRSEKKHRPWHTKVGNQ